MGSSFGVASTRSLMSGRLKRQAHTAQDFSLVGVLAGGGTEQKRDVLRTIGRRFSTERDDSCRSVSEEGSCFEIGHLLTRIMYVLRYLEPNTWR